MFQDEILCCVLSFIPFSDMIKYSIVCKDWKRIIYNDIPDYISMRDYCHYIISCENFESLISYAHMHDNIYKQFLENGKTLSTKAFDSHKDFKRFIIDKKIRYKSFVCIGFNHGCNLMFYCNENQSIKFKVPNIKDLFS